MVDRFERMAHDLFMFSAFFESFRYVSHLIPLAFMRVYMGYYFFEQGLLNAKGEFLLQPRLAAQISEWLPQSSAPLWYKSFVGEYVVEHWRVFAYSITYFEFLIAVSFILGFFVRPVAILGMFLCLNFIYNSNPITVDLHRTMFALFFVMLWAGAGRCFGFDYFFFKRHRGIWW